MKKQKFEIWAAEENSQAGSEQLVGCVLARCHKQHVYGKTTLIGLSASGAKKLHALKSLGAKIYVAIGGRGTLETGAKLTKVEHWG